MTDYVWPDALAPSTVTFYLQSHTGRSESPFTRAQKVYGLSRPRWVCRMMVRGGYAGADLAGKGAALDGFLAKLKGGQNRVLVHDFRRTEPAGGFASFSDYVAEFAGLTFTFDGGETFNTAEEFVVDGIGVITNLSALQGATEMSFTGAAPSRTVLRAGDYLGGDGRPHIITDDVVSDTNGRFTVTFEPPLETDVSAGAAFAREVRGTFRLTSDDAGANPTEVGGATTYDIELVEDL